MQAYGFDGRNLAGQTCSVGFNERRIEWIRQGSPVHKVLPVKNRGHASDHSSNLDCVARANVDRPFKRRRNKQRKGSRHIFDEQEVSPLPTVRAGRPFSSKKSGCDRGYETGLGFCGTIDEENARPDVAQPEGPGVGRHNVSKRAFALAVEGRGVSRRILGQSAPRPVVLRAGSRQNGARPPGTGERPDEKKRRLDKRDIFVVAGSRPVSCDHRPGHVNKMRGPNVTKKSIRGACIPKIACVPVRTFKERCSRSARRVNFEPGAGQKTHHRQTDESTGPGDENARTRQRDNSFKVAARSGQLPSFAETTSGVSGQTIPTLTSFQHRPRSKSGA